MRSVLIKYSFICYALITLGQLWLYSLNLKTDGFHERVTLYSNEWIGSHVVLLLGAMLIVPATLVLKDYSKTASKNLVYTATVLTILGAVALMGQYIVDFYLIVLFKGQTSKSAYAALDLIQTNAFIKFVCYDLVAAWLLGQILFTIALFKIKNYQKWTWVLFVLGIILVILGDSIHELLERFSYVLFSIALLPIFSEMTPFYSAKK